MLGRAAAGEQYCLRAPPYLEGPLLGRMQRFPLGGVHELVRKDVVQKLPILAHSNPDKRKEDTVWERVITALCPLPKSLMAEWLKSSSRNT